MLKIVNIQKIACWGPASKIIIFDQFQPSATSPLWEFYRLVLLDFVSLEACIEPDI